MHIADVDRSGKRERLKWARTYFRHRTSTAWHAVASLHGFSTSYTVP